MIGANIFADCKSLPNVLDDQVICRESDYVVAVEIQESPKMLQ